MKHVRLSLFIIFSAVLASCTRGLEIEGFSEREWKSDRNGCMNLRHKYRDPIMTSKDHILGRTENSVLKTLGRPDKNELLSRQQKNYTYYLEPGPLCDNMAGLDSTSYLLIRFNATGIVNEMYVSEDKVTGEE